MSQTVALLLIFVALPFIVAPIVIALVARRSPSLPSEYRTSELLAHGEVHRGEIVEWRNRGQFLDRQPMVAMKVRVGDEEMLVMQSFPRSDIRRLRAGLAVEVRLSADHKAGAVVLPDEDDDDNQG